MYQFSLCAFADEADPSVEGQIRALKENGIEIPFAYLNVIQKQE